MSEELGGGGGWGRFWTVPRLSRSWSGSSCMMMISSSFPGNKVDLVICLSWIITPWFGACFSSFFVSFCICCEGFRGGKSTSEFPSWRVVPALPRCSVVLGSSAGSFPADPLKVRSHPGEEPDRPLFHEFYQSLCIEYLFGECRISCLVVLFLVL